MRNELTCKIFKYLGLGLLTTFLVGYFSSINMTVASLLNNFIVLLILVVSELIIAFTLAIKIKDMSNNTAVILYFSYAILTGLTLSSIFIVYEITSIIYVFLASAIIFIIFAFIGKNINIDLSKLGTFLLIGLLSIIILEIINIFLLSRNLNMVLSTITLFIFTLYIAYDINYSIKLIKYTDSDNVGVLGAFQLYLDFINIFIRLLNLFGKRK